jgi:hypothetical protein
MDPIQAANARIPVRLAEIDVAQALVLAASQRLRAYDAYVLQAVRTEGASLLTLSAFRRIAQSGQRRRKRRRLL